MVDWQFSRTNFAASRHSLRLVAYSSLQQTAPDQAQLPVPGVSETLERMFLLHKALKIYAVCWHLTSWLGLTPVKRHRGRNTLTNFSLTALCAQILNSDKGLFLTLQISARKFAGLPFHLCFCWLHQVALNPFDFATTCERVMARKCYYSMFGECCMRVPTTCVTGKFWNESLAPATILTVYFFSPWRMKTIVYSWN